MYNANNPRHKLTPSQVKEAQILFEDEGWRINWISAFFGIYKTSIIFHVRYNGWVRRMKVLQHMPKEVADIYRQRKKQKYGQRMRGTYDFIKQSADQYKSENCQHVRWIKRCSLCGEILGSDATHNH
jgi:hypothetical protein